MNVSLPVSVASSVLSLVLAFQAYHSFKYVRKDYLLDFSAGFMLLGLSFGILAWFSLGLKLPGHFQDVDDLVNYPVFALMQSSGFILIALAYSQSVSARKILVGLMGFLISLVILIILPAFIVPSSIDVLLYLLNAALLGLVLYHMLRVMPGTHLVFAGFLLLAMCEYTAITTAVNETLYSSQDGLSFLTGSLFYLSGLFLLFLSFVETRRKVPSVQFVEVVGN